MCFVDLSTILFLPSLRNCLMSVTGWKQTVQTLLDRFTDLLEQPADGEEAFGGEHFPDDMDIMGNVRSMTNGGETSKIVALAKLRQHFQKVDVQP